MKYFYENLMQILNAMENTYDISDNTDVNAGFDNDSYIADITKIEEANDYDWYNFYPDASF